MFAMANLQVHCALKKCIQNFYVVLQLKMLVVSLTVECEF